MLRHCVALTAHLLVTASDARTLDWIGCAPHSMSIRRGSRRLRPPAARGAPPARVRAQPASGPAAAQNPRARNSAAHEGDTNVSASQK